MTRTRLQLLGPSLLLQGKVTRSLGTIPTGHIANIISCIAYSKGCHDQVDVWHQLWRFAIRSVSLPGTSRAAAVLLHQLLEADVLPYHTISQDINNMVTTADVSGPSTLSDASISLMFHVLNLRNAKVPSASQSTCHHIIRWVFLRWNPSEFVVPNSNTF